MKSPLLPAKPVAQVLLKLANADGEDPKHNLSAGTRVGRSLFLAGDEMAVLEVLTLDTAGLSVAHDRYRLADLLDLLEPDAEVDIEGLSAEDGWLWVVGSHARTRNKPDKSPGLRIDLGKLADLKDTRPRCVLARIPLVEDPQAPGVFRPTRSDGDRRAGLLRQTKRGNKLAEMLRADPLIAPFTAIPAKEGGVDIEGIAVAAPRVALGMRGPVIRDFAVLLELEIQVGASGRLKLGLPPLKRLLDLEGLGIRDLKRCGDDLLILAGPTSSLSGPCALYVWRDWANEPASGQDVVALHRPERLFYLPVGRGVDHPEGLALWDGAGGRDKILVLCDSPAPARFEEGPATFLADLFDLPK
ncbi:hypothetical protein Sa4125_05580 [Aureimonas sp. SA4125]|uniref:DUF3616 domain-containing protein n=1 Tax=Aureimonas sp. SA4125 TaxID=2826993 RepID=UPI001CC5DDD0|nr:DUF3616 domain-containing protein [Aureimonas sp. SA4125]BDA83016.1 hypothetical protein Sa4125_05580 [Aureimonas sp. SA4125]